MQKRFCEILVADKEEKQYLAYENAGYKARGAAARVNASKLLTNPNIKTYIKILRDKRSKRTDITADLVLKTLWRLTLKCMADVPILTKVNGELVETGEYKIDSFGANKALELIAKHLGMFTGKGENPAQFNIYNLLGGNGNGSKSDSELETDYETRAAIIGNNGSGSADKNKARL